MTKLTGRYFARRDTDVSPPGTGPSGASRRLINAAALRRARVDDDAVTEVIGYVLSFALSAMFLLIALNVFHAARGNTEQVVTGVELKAISDKVASDVVDMGLVAQEFPNATMETSIDIPQSLTGRLYTVKATPAQIFAYTNDGELRAEASTYKTDAIPGIFVDGEVDSSNQRIIIRYSDSNIIISGE